MPGSRLNTKNRVSLKIAVLKIVMHAAIAQALKAELRIRGMDHLTSFHLNALI
jgi:hypothetical protein